MSLLSQTPLPPTGGEEIIVPSHPHRRKRLLGTAVFVGQPFLLNAISLPVTAYIIRSLGEYSYGQWATAMALIAVVSFVANLGLRGAFVRQMAQHPELASTALAEQLGARIALAVFASAVAIVSAVLLRHPAVVIECTAIAAVGFILTVIASTNSDFLQAMHRLDVVGGVNFIAGIFLTLTSIFVVYAGFGPVGLCLAYLIQPLITAIALGVIVHRQHVRVRISLGRQQLYQLVKRSRFFFAQQLSASASKNVQGLVVPKIVGASGFGLFSAGMLLADRLSMMPELLASAYYPYIARRYKNSVQDGTRQAMACLSLTLLLCMPVAILAAFYAAPISQILFPRHPDLCRRVIQVTVWVLPLFGIECVVGYALNAAGKDSIQAHLGVPIGVCSVLLAAILVWRFGVTGACWSFVLRPAISVGFSLPAFIKTFSPKLSDLPVVGILGCSATMASAMLGARYVLPVVQPPGPAHEWGFSIASLTIQTLVGITAYGISLVVFRLVRLADIARLGAEMIS